jgi:hypothetical protein
MTQTPRIVYRARHDATLEAEHFRLAAVYRIVLRAEKRGRLPDKSGDDDGTQVKEDSANEHPSTGVEPACFRPPAGEGMEVSCEGLSAALEATASWTRPSSRPS